MEVFIWMGEWVSYGVYNTAGGFDVMDELSRKGYKVMHIPS